MVNPGTNIKLVIFDMAGTIINEKGIIYKAIGNTLKNLGFIPNNIESWYGRDKKEVLYSEIKKHSNDPYLICNTVNHAEKELVKELEKEYFTNSNIKLVDNTKNVFNDLRFNNIKIALNTGYPSRLQKNIINHFELENHIDAYVSSEEVKYGRPYPYMIYNLMEQCEIKNVKDVVKVGDTVNDLLEGKNAGCGKSVGVLSGAGNKKELKEISKYVIDDISMLDIFI